MERMTREQMVAEFGEPGVQNPGVMDLITVDDETGAVVLAMIERRPWGSTALQLRQIEEKINRYMAYALDGFLVEHHPQHEGRPVLVRLDCAEEPHGEAPAFLEAAGEAIRAHGLAFRVNVTG